MRHLASMSEGFIYAWWRHTILQKARFTIVSERLLQTTYWTYADRNHNALRWYRGFLVCSTENRLRPKQEKTLKPGFGVKFDFRNWMYKFLMGRQSFVNKFDIFYAAENILK